MSTKVILVDDHRLMRDGLRTLLQTELGMEVVGEADDGLTAVTMAEQLSPDIIIMDVGMPGIDGIDATSRITDKLPNVKVIALSMHANKLFVMDMFKAGASGYLLKECASDELATAINTVLTGDVYLSPKVAGVVLDAHLKRPSMTRSSTALLTQRECEVLRLVASGKSSKEIAIQYKKSIQTIDACRRQIMAKLKLENSAQLIKYAIREGLTTLDL